jgi:hypothetical protein
MDEGVVAFSSNDPHDRLHPQIDQVKLRCTNVIGTTLIL